MYNSFLHIHIITAIVFLLFYLIKTVLLVLNKETIFIKINGKTNIPQRLIEVIFLISGIYLSFNSGMVQIGNWFWIKLILFIILLPLGIMAMAKRRKIMAVICLLGFLYLYGVSETKSPVFDWKQGLISHSTMDGLENMELKEAAEYIFLQNCAVCHGKKGTKGLSGANELINSEKTPGEMIQIINTGKNAMPGYESVLSQGQISSIVDYILELKKKGAG